MPETHPRTSVTIEIIDVFIASNAYTIVRNVLSQVINQKNTGCLESGAIFSTNERKNKNG